MSIRAEVLPKHVWDKIAGLAHIECFGVEFQSEAKHYTSAVLVKIDDKNLLYGTVKELDAESAHINFGGVFKEFKGQGLSTKGFKAMLTELRAKYKRVGFTTRTKNTPMIKLGLNCGFEIVGLRKVYGVPSLEFLLEGGI